MKPFRKFTSIRNTIGSGLKRVATGSVSKRYQTLHKNTIFENVFFDLISPLFNSQNLQEESLDKEFTFKGKCFQLLRGLEWCKHSTTTKPGVQ